MNQNDMDRYYWRTGQRWSSDDRSESELRGPKLKFTRWTVILLVASFIGTTVTLFLLHSS